MTGHARRLAPGVALVVTLAVTGCGATPTEEYCATLKDKRRDFSEISAAANPSAALVEAVPMLEELQAAAPSDLKDEWQVFVNAVAGLRDAIERAGLRPEDFRGQQVPERVTGQQRRDLVAAADVLGSPDVLSAAEGIESQAQDVCKVDLGL